MRDNVSWKYTEYTEYGVAFWPVCTPGFGPRPAPEPEPAQEHAPQRVLAQRLDRPEQTAIAACEPGRELARRPVEPLVYEENGYHYVDGTITAAEPGMSVSENYYAIPYATTWSTVELY